MSGQIVKQRSRGFICTNAHPAGCAANLANQIAAVTSQRPAGVSGAQRVLVIGSSTGYGLSTRIATAWGFGAKTIGVFFERPPDGRRTASAGFYNSAAFHRAAKTDGIYAASINGDAFSDEIKREAAAMIRKDMGQVDLVVYSLASPRRVHPRTGETHNSALKPIGAAYTGKTVDFSTGEVSEVTIDPADAAEIADTIAVMGGEDWRYWIELLLSEGLLAEGARTLAYSYIGPEQTWPIYRDGTIGAAKKDLSATADALDQTLQESVGGHAWVSVNKAVVTQASSAIPVVPLYISLLFAVMKRKGIHEGCIEQMRRLCFAHLAEGRLPELDAGRLLRLDNLEMRDDVQQEVAALWPQATSENVEEISDLAGYRRDFSNLFGFDVEGVDYEAPVETEITLDA